MRNLTGLRGWEVCVILEGDFGLHKSSSETFVKMMGITV